MWTNEKLVEELQSLYDGKPWLDVTIQDSLVNISAEKAGSHPIKNANSIWTIINHLIFWHHTVTGRLNNCDEIYAAAEEDFIPVTDFTEEAWQKVREKLQISLGELVKVIMDFDEAKWDQICPGRQTSFFENAMGIIEHDAYHLGQIVLLKKAL